MKSIFKNILNFLSKIKQDKLLHFIVGLILFEVFYGLMVSLFAISTWVSRGLSFTLIVLIGMWKDFYYDKKNGGTVDIKDVTATELGAITGLVLTFIF
jgi:hypothetical protein